MEMPKTIIAEGKTSTEAIEKGLKELKVSRNQVDVKILEEKKNGKTKIDKQFEYNTYIRDFFADNRDKSLDEAIKCWKYKKQLSGHNRYEKSDLDVLDK